jgi:hypothetical protein
MNQGSGWIQLTKSTRDLVTQSLKDYASDDHSQKRNLSVTEEIDERRKKGRLSSSQNVTKCVEHFSEIALAME